MSLTRKCLARRKTSEKTNNNHRWCHLPPCGGQEPAQRCRDAWVTGRKRGQSHASSRVRTEWRCRHLTRHKADGVNRKNRILISVSEGQLRP